LRAATIMGFYDCYWPFVYIIIALILKIFMIIGLASKNCLNIENIVDDELYVRR